MADSILKSQPFLCCQPFFVKGLFQKILNKKNYFISEVVL